MRRFLIYLAIPLVYFVFKKCDTRQTAVEFNDKLIEQFEMAQNTFSRLAEDDSDYNYSELKAVNQRAIREVKKIEDYDNGTSFKMSVLSFLETMEDLLGESEEDFLNNLQDHQELVDRLIDKEDEVIKQQKIFADNNNLKLEYEL